MLLWKHTDLGEILHFDKDDHKSGNGKRHSHNVQETMQLQNTIFTWIVNRLELLKQNKRYMNTYEY